VGTQEGCAAHHCAVAAAPSQHGQVQKPLAVPSLQAPKVRAHHSLAPCDGMLPMCMHNPLLPAVATPDFGGRVAHHPHIMQRGGGGVEWVAAQQGSRL